MYRALYTAASGMQTQQLNLENVANNLANGSTAGFRRRRLQFQDLLYQNMVSYADFITLLFAFFVVLYSSSQVDKRRVGRLALAIQVAFQELGVFDTSNTKVPLSNTEAIPFSNIQAVENVQRTGDLQRFIQR